MDKRIQMEFNDQLQRINSCDHRSVQQLHHQDFFFLFLAYFPHRIISKVVKWKAAQPDVGV